MEETMKYWIAVASKEHVMNGLREGICQVCHGKEGPLKRMAEGDYLLYYSPTHTFRGKDPCQAFTALGRVRGGEPYPFQMSPTFIPYRRDIDYQPAIEVPIRPLIPHLSFIPNKAQWGYPFRWGCFSIPESDFKLIQAQT